MRVTDAKDARDTEREEGEIEVVETDGGTKIVYAPEGIEHNYYSEIANTVVLDSELRQNETVHDIILSHELQHAENGYQSFRGIARNLILEFKTDVYHIFSMSEDAKKVRDYYDNREYGTKSLMNVFGTGLINFLRSSWNLIFVPTGKLYRSVWRWLHD